MKISDAKLQGLRCVTHYASQLPKDQGISSRCTVYFYAPLSVKAGLFTFLEVKTLRVVNLSNGTELADQVSAADTFFKRLKGLMFTKSLLAGHGLHIQPCRSIHTFFMNYPIDVLYLSEQLEIVGVDEILKPASVGKYQRKAFSVLELPAGTIKKTETRIGQYLLIK